MRIFVLGATGKTGSALVRLALKDGHSVTAFVRSPKKLTTLAGLNVVEGTPADIPAMARAMAGHDAVFLALAPAVGDLLSSPRKRAWTMTSYAENITQAMQQAGVKRFLAFTSGALFPGQSLIVRMLMMLPPAQRHHADLLAMEGVVATTPLEWTLARPGSMAKGEGVAYRAQADAMVAAAKPMTFDGLARFLLDAAAEERYVRQIVGLAR